MAIGQYYTNCRVAVELLSSAQLNSTQRRFNQRMAIIVRLLANIIKIIKTWPKPPSLLLPTNDVYYDDDH
jgi:hypothetical protein